MPSWILSSSLVCKGGSSTSVKAGDAQRCGFQQEGQWLPEHDQEMVEHMISAFLTRHRGPVLMPPGAHLPGKDCSNYLMLSQVSGSSG